MEAETPEQAEQRVINMADTRTKYYWADRNVFQIQQESVAHSGRVAIVRTKMEDRIGSLMTVRYTLAPSATVIGYLEQCPPDGPNDPFEMFGYSVIFVGPNPITYQNMIIRDGNIDLYQTVADVGERSSNIYGQGDLMIGFDYFFGTLSLLIVGLS
jgi:hypothetical protein